MFLLYRATKLIKFFEQHKYISSSYIVVVDVIFLHSKKTNASKESNDVVVKSLAVSVQFPPAPSPIFLSAADRYCSSSKHRRSQYYI
jgi:hypothetical protein